MGIVITTIMVMIWLGAAVYQGIRVIKRKKNRSQLPKWLRIEKHQDYCDEVNGLLLTIFVLPFLLAIIGFILYIILKVFYIFCLDNSELVGPTNTIISIVIFIYVLLSFILTFVGKK